MDIRGLHVVRALDPALDVDVAHLLPREEGVVLQHHVVRVPDDAAQLVASTTRKGGSRQSRSLALWILSLGILSRHERGSRQSRSLALWILYLWILSRHKRGSRQSRSLALWILSYLGILSRHKRGSRQLRSLALWILFFFYLWILYLWILSRHERGSRQSRSLALWILSYLWILYPWILSRHEKGQPSVTFPRPMDTLSMDTVTSRNGATVSHVA